MTGSGLHGCLNLCSLYFHNIRTMPKRLINFFITLALCLRLTAAESGNFRVEVRNDLPQMRTEMAEVSASEFPQSDFVIRDDHSCEVPWQRTFDGKIIFPVSVGPNGTAVFNISEGKPSRVEKICQASFYPERIDDFAWENDYCAYRAYGPASKGEMSGYDVFTKSNTRPVVAERYFNELVRRVSYHVDHGDGMDQYDVGPTLGAGGSAPVGKNGNLILPGAFSKWRILENGPLRTTFELIYEYGGGRDTRTFTLDAGTPFNHVVSHLEGFDVDSIASGIVVHKGDTKSYTSGEGYAAYSDPTSAPTKGNGRIFIGVVNTDGGNVSYRSLPKTMKGGVGHLLLKSRLKRDKDYSYYWGASWSKGKTATFNQWVCEIEDFIRCRKNPLRIKILK